MRNIRPIDADSLKAVPNVRKVTEYDETGCGLDYLAIPVDVIEAASTLDVAPVVHARWIWNAHKQFYECSRCAGARYHDLMLGLNAQYCGYCGAKMIGDEK